MTVIYGIDLGTTYTKCAVMMPGDREPRLVPLDMIDRKQVTGLRSAVTLSVERGQKVAYVGSAAWTKFENADPDEVDFRRFEESKLYIGAADDGDPYAPPWPFRPHEFEYRPEHIGAIILRRVKQMIVAKGLPPAERIVLTHPQCFSGTRREATRRAAELAELEVVETLTEPDAAAITYGVERSSGIYMVFDLGGGTLDITIAKIEKGHTEVLTSEGIRQGGRDWDRRIFEQMLEEYSQVFQDFSSADLDDMNRSNWMRRAETIKQQLNAADGAGSRRAARCKLLPRPDAEHVFFDLSLDDFNRITRELLESCRNCCEQALKNRGMNWRELSGVLLVGGSTRLLQVQRMLKDVSGLDVNTEIDPDTVVVKGAAIYAQGLARGAAS